MLIPVTLPGRSSFVHRPTVVRPASSLRSLLSEPPVAERLAVEEDPGSEQHAAPDGEPRALGCLERYLFDPSADARCRFTALRPAFRSASRWSTGTCIV